MSLKLRGPDGHQKLVVHTDKVLWSDFTGRVVKATLDKDHCVARIFNPHFVNSIFLSSASQLEQECQIWRDLKHPNIVQVLGMVQNPLTDSPIILMELMEQKLTKFRMGPYMHNALPYHLQVNMSHDIAIAVHHLHRNGILHRNLISDNILLRGHYQAKVAGFSSSTNVVTNPRAMTPGIAFLSPPESLLPERCYSEKSDCYSAGILLLQMVTRIGVSLEQHSQFDAIAVSAEGLV